MWFNYCDDWTDWTPSGYGITYNTTTAVYAQGSKSLALSFSGTVGYAYSNLTLTNSTMDDNSTNRCWAFWWRSESDGAVPADYMKWMVDQANWFGFYQSGARSWNWQIVISGVAYGAHFIQTCAADTWYYFECNFTSGGTGWEIFIDGVNKYTYGGSLPFYPIIFQYAFYQSNNGESLYLDALRVSDNTEYPPTYPPEPPGPGETYPWIMPFLPILGIIGLACMITGPTYGIYKMWHHEYVAGLQAIIVFGMLGMGLFLGWLGRFG